MTLNELREFLDPVIISNKYIFLDFWNLLHFFSGIIIFATLLKFFKNIKTPNKFIILFLLLLSWEIFELLTYRFFESSLIFFGFADLFWDVIIGMLGGILVHYIYKFRLINL